MVNDGAAAPTFGLWYGFRQEPTPGDYARSYAECFEEIEGFERLGCPFVASACSTCTRLRSRPAPR